MYQFITLQHHGNCALISFNRPDQLNALTDSMLDEFKHALAQAEADAAVTGIVITGSGRGFCAGMDMNALDGISSEGEHLRAKAAQELSAQPGDSSMGKDFAEGFTFMMSIRKPIIAAVNGACAGLGLSIALLCDLRMASNNAKFVTAFAPLGLVAEHGQSWLLPRLVGPAVALDLLWSSRKVLAAEALQIGLVNRVVDAEQLVSEAIGYINDLAARAAPLSLKAMKRQVYRHLNCDLGQAMLETNELMAASLAHDDFKEGVASFVEKRSPQFENITVD